MKKLVIFLSVSVSVVTIVVLPTESTTISPWAGYTSFAMEDVNSQTKDLAEFYENFGSTVSLNNFTGGYIAGVDIDMFRLAYILPATGKLDTKFLGSDLNYKMEISLVMALIGLRISDPARPSLSIGVYAGYGYTSVNFTTYSLMPFPSEEVEIPYAGGDIVGEVVIGLKSDAVEFNIGYRYALIRQVEVTEDVDWNEDDIPDYEAGDVFEKAEDDPLAFDYSGLMVSLGLRFGPESQWNYW